MIICKSCGVTVHEEGQMFCPACKSTAKEAHLGFGGSSGVIEKVELKMDDEEPKQVTSLKLSETHEKTDKVGTVGVPEASKTDKIKTAKLDQEFKHPSSPSEKPKAAAVDDDRLAISESPLAESANLSAEAPTLQSAVDKTGPKSYLSAEERKALLSELDRPKAAVKEPPPKISLSGESTNKIEMKRSAAMTLREPSPAVSPGSNPEPARADKLPHTAVSRGIAYFSGTRIHLVGGAHLVSGDEMVFKDRIYVLKEKPGGEGSNHRIYGAAAAILVLAAGLLWSVSRPTPGGIAGLLLDSRTQSTLPGTKVRIMENGEATLTNEAGFFVLPRVPAGNYNLAADAPGIEGQTQVQVAKGGISPVILTLNPTPEEIISKAPILNPRATAQRAPEVPVVREPVTVALNLSLDPADAEAFLDGQPLGNGGIFKDMVPGKHQLTAKRPGYLDYEQEINLQSGKANRVRVAMVPKATAPAPAKKGFDDYFKEGEGYLSRQEFNRATAAFSEAVKLRPNSSLAHSLLAEAHWGAGDDGSGNRHAMKAAALFSADGSYPRAQGLYTKILEKDPSQAEAFLSLGNLFFSVGNLEEARTTFQQYNKQFDNAPEGYFALGKLEYQERRFKEAAKAFEKALSNSSQPGMIYGYLTLTYIQNDSKRKAQPAYDNFMKLATPQELNFLKSHRDWSRVVADLSVRE